MRPFREEDEPFFFGRATFAETLTATVLRKPFVAVVGASGSGKSSVVRAGLLPRLRRKAGGLVWDALTLVPTDRPLHSLAAALLPMLEPNLSEVDRLAEVNKLAAHLADGSVALRDVAARVLQKQQGTDRLLLFGYRGRGRIFGESINSTSSLRKTQEFAYKTTWSPSARGSRRCRRMAIGQPAYLDSCFFPLLL